MPEGHAIHRIARDHSRWFLQQPLTVESPQGRFAEEAERLQGRELTRIEAHGKHLFYFWRTGEILHIHLGLYGKFRLRKLPMPEPRGQIRLRMVAGERGFDLNGPNRCELLETSAAEKILARLGEDPLRKDACPEKLWDFLQKSRAAIGRVLMDQSRFAGVGNIYRTEVLFAIGIPPELPARELSREQFEGLWQQLVDWMQLGVRVNRIITVDHKQFEKPNSRLTREERLQIYKKETCPNCENDVEKLELASRAVYVCRNCQG